MNQPTAARGVSPDQLAGAVSIDPSCTPSRPPAAPLWVGIVLVNWNGWRNALLRRFDDRPAWVCALHNAFKQHEASHA